MRHPLRMLVTMLAVGVLAVGVSCKKKEDTPPDRTALLTARTWRISQVKANNTPLTDQLLQQVAGQAGLLGQIYNSNVVFKADGTFSSPNNNTVSGTWTFNTDKTELTLVSGGQSNGFKVITLSETSLVLESLSSYTVNVPIIGDISARVTLEMAPA